MTNPWVRLESYPASNPADVEEIRRYAKDRLRLVSELRNRDRHMPRVCIGWESHVWERFEALARGEDLAAADELTTFQLERCSDIAFRWQRLDVLVKAAEHIDWERIIEDRELETRVIVAKRMLEIQQQKQAQSDKPS